MKIWSTEKADRVFSDLIRIRDKMCAYDLCGPATDCSHFYERGNSSVRYHPHNADGLSRKCHQRFHRDRAEYKRWKLVQLGVADYLALQRLSAMTMKRDVAIIKLMESFNANI